MAEGEEEEGTERDGGGETQTNKTRGGEVLTLGGLPRFLLASGLEGPAAAVGSPAFLFLLPFGRPRPRFTGVEGSAVGTGEKRDGRVGMVRISIRGGRFSGRPYLDR